DDVDTSNRAVARLAVANIALNQAESRPGVRPHPPLDLVQVPPMSGSEIIENDDTLTTAEERFNQVGANKPRPPCDEPRAARRQRCCQIAIVRKLQPILRGQESSSGRCAGPVPPTCACFHNLMWT